MKIGANKLDQAQIKKGYEKGMSAVEIAEILKIDVTCVKSFEPKPKKAPKPTKAD